MKIRESKYPKEFIKTFIFLVRKGKTKSTVIHELKKIDSSFAEANYNYWMVRFCPDLLSSDRQIQYQQIYRLFKKSNLRRQDFCLQYNVGLYALKCSIYFNECDIYAPWLKDFEKEFGIVRKPIVQLPEECDAAGSTYGSDYNQVPNIQVIDSLEPNANPTDIPLSAILNDHVEAPSNAAIASRQARAIPSPQQPIAQNNEANKVTVKIGKSTSISWTASGDVESSICRLIISLTQAGVIL